MITRRIFTTAELAPWVRQLIEHDESAHWCSDLAGLISSAPSDEIDGRTYAYGVRSKQRNFHPWTVDNIVRWVIIPLAWLDVSQNDPVEWKLGALLVDLLDADLYVDTMDALHELIACLWDVLLRPDLLDGGTTYRERAERWQLYTDALTSIGLLGVDVP